MKGWFYYFLGVCVVAIALLYKDLDISLSTLLVSALLAGYLLGCLLYSVAPLLVHIFRWIINYGNYRHYYRTTTRKKSLFKLRLSPFAR